MIFMLVQAQCTAHKCIHRSVELLQFGLLTLYTLCKLDLFIAGATREKQVLNQEAFIVPELQTNYFQVVCLLEHIQLNCLSPCRALQ